MTLTIGDELPLQSTAALAGVVVAGLLSLLYWAALPKPIPGIPYNKAAARRLLGDAPDMAKAKRVRGWMQDQFARHDAPVIQLFTAPFQKPWVYVADFREAHDEFDRSGLTADCFSGIMPEFQMNMKSVDPRYKHNKNLVKDLMAPTFLTEVSGPELYEKMSLLLDLWEIKTRVANGRPFRADLDIYNWALDITMAVAFNFPRENTMVAKTIAHINDSEAANGKGKSSGSQTELFEFSMAPLDPELEACLYLANSVGVAFRSPVPRLAHWLYLQKPYSKVQTRIKQELIRRNIDDSLERLERSGPDPKLACAVDHVLLRERDRAAKLGAAPEFHKPAIYDELFGFIVGGHDTTSTTFQWWVKYMGLYPASQTRLREALHSAHGNVLFKCRRPTVHEITHTSIPYLDAMVEEAFRYSHIVPFVTREAIVDTQLLGHAIPRGTQVMFVTSAESFIKPAFAIDPARRAATAAKGGNNEALRYGVWDPVDVGEFKPERWLRRVGEGEMQAVGSDEGAGVDRVVFNPRAGPVLAFGAGPRGCFGRRLAYLEMRIAITLLIWECEFLDMPAELNNLESVDTSTESPKDCYVRLRKIDY